MQPSYIRVVWTAIVTASLAPMTCAQGGYTVLAHYPFDDGTANDASGNGHHGVIIGDVVPGPGILGSAMRFDETGGHIRVPDRGDLQSDRVSLTMWIKINEPPQQDAVLLAKRDGMTGYELRLLAESGAVAFRVLDGQDEGEVIAPFPVMPDEWTAIAARYDGIDLKLHLHGSDAAVTSAPGIEFSTDADVKIGLGLPDEIFTGMIDEVYLAEGVIPDPTACANALKLWDAPSECCINAMQDVTFDLGLEDQEHRHFGACLVDVNGDGWVDLYYVNGIGDPVDLEDYPPTGVCPDPEDIDTPAPENFNAFYLNNGDGTFGPDIAPEIGLDDWWNAMRHAFGDYDNDGRRDVISHNFLVSPLYRNVSTPEDLLWVDASDEADLNLCLTRGTGASWVDLNHDGFLDLYAVEYDPTRPADEHLNLMFLNNGDGTFTDITEEAGVTLPDNPMGVIFGDYDNDGDQDVFNTNSHEAPSRLYRHEGLDPKTGIPQFVDVAPEAGVAIDLHGSLGIGAGWGDYNNDGRLDLLFVREDDSHLFRNDGPNGEGLWTFTDVTGVGGLDIAGDESLVFWGGNFADLDNDGWLDIVLANREANNGPNLVFLNNRDGTWNEVGELLGMDLVDFAGLGFVPGDIDNDGDLDAVIITHVDGDPNFVFRNEERGNNWIQFRLTGTVSNLDAVGSRITVTAQLEPGGPLITQIREVVAGTGFFADIPRIQTFGLGKAVTIEQAQIRWPNGLVQDIGPLEVNRRLDFIEPADIAGDFNGDGLVGADDLLHLLGAWGPCDECGACVADLDGDCIVGTSDLLILLGNWS